MSKKNLKIVFIVILGISVFLLLIYFLLYSVFSFLFGKKYYSDQQVKGFTQTLVPGSTYITKKRVKDSTGRDTYYLFKDSYGREFIIKSVSVEYVLYYRAELRNAYRCCISQKYSDEIKAILDDTGLKYSLRGEALELQDDMIKWAIESPSLRQKEICFSDIKEEDLTVIADALTKIDGILKYNYNKGMKSKILCDDYSLYDVSIYLADLEYRDLIHISFSTSESERWTQEHLYESIHKQYEENVAIETQDKKNEEREKQQKKVEEERQKQEKEQQEQEKKEQKKLEQTIKMDMLNYLSEKYDETFIVDEYSFFEVDDLSGDAYFLLYCERLPSVKIRVYGSKNADGTYSYTDDFDEGRKYEDND